MLYIDGNTIRLTRGDTAYLHIPLATTEGTYEMEPSDILTLSVKKSVRDTDYIFQTVVTGVNIFHIEPSYTSESAFGKYVYDVQLRNENGDIFTVIPPSTFEILAEVTC